MSNYFTNIKPLRDYVLIQPSKNSGPTLTESGIIIPDIGKSIIKNGTVIDIGPDVTEVQIADCVIYEDSDTKGKEEVLDGQLKINRIDDDYILIREENLMAVVVMNEQ